MSALRTEADVLRALASDRHAVTVDELYAACVAAGVHTRDDGEDVIHGRTDCRWKRRARNALQHAKRSGRARQVDRGVWVFDGERDHGYGGVTIRRALLVVAGVAFGDIEMRLAAAEDLLGQLAGEGVEVHLVVGDPPYALAAERAHVRTAYARDGEQVVPGYVDVPCGAYDEFTVRWTSAAAKALRPGGTLAIITGPGQSAAVQLGAERAGLVWVNQIVAKRPFSMRTTRRFSHAHHVITVMARPDGRGWFTCPDDLPKAASGRDYPLDWWADIPKQERRGLVRYDNQLHPLVVDRTVRAYTPGPENGGRAWEALVVDPFLGGGTTLEACARRQRRFIGGDINPAALAYAAARIATEVAPLVPEDAERTQVGQLLLFGADW